MESGKTSHKDTKICVHVPLGGTVLLALACFPPCFPSHKNIEADNSTLFGFVGTTSTDIPHSDDIHKEVVDPIAACLGKTKDQLIAFDCDGCDGCDE
tara:strand:+ start:2210 stop:2500 length:291 start_codon:yes stop_codon:yes gene_type:complete